MFINDEDFKVVVGDSSLKVISQADSGNRDNALMEAQEEICGYLRPKYDCESIFSAEGNARNKQIVLIACDIALYYLVSASPQKMGIEIRKERYDRAVKWLEGVQAGKIIPDLPMAVDENGQSTGTQMFFGSQKKQRNNW